MRKKKVNYCFRLLLILCGVFFLNVSNGMTQDYIYSIGGSKFDCGNCLYAESSEPTFVITGQTKSIGFGNSGAFITKYKRLPVYPFIDLVWSKVDSTGIGIGNCIKATSDAYIMCGQTSKNILLTQVKKSGVPVFAYSFNVGEKDKSDFATKIIVDQNGDFVLVGTTYTQNTKGDILIAKFDGSGNSIWAKRIGKQRQSNLGTAIMQDSDGNYVVLGCTGTNNQQDIVIIKLNKDGEHLISKRLIPNGNDSNDYPHAIVDCPGIDVSGASQGAYVVAGWTRSFQQNSNRKLLLFKIQKNLNNIIWGKVLIHSGDEAALSLIKTAEDSLVVAGHTLRRTPGSNLDALYAKFNINGDFLWARVPKHKLALNKNEEINAIVTLPGLSRTDYTNYLAIGSTNSAGFGNSDILLTSLSDISMQCYQKLYPKVMPVELKSIKFVNPFPVKLSSKKLKFDDKALDNLLICPN